MTTLRIENTVHDFDAWKDAFDKFDRFRADNGVLRYRISRPAGDDTQAVVDLDFATTDEAVAFRGALEAIWRTPQAQQQLVTHSEPQLVEVLEERVPLS